MILPNGIFQLFLFLIIEHFQKTSCKKLIISDNFPTVKNSSVYVDKTILIKEIFQLPGVNLLITAPNGFGKSTNLDMLREFIDCNKTHDEHLKTQYTFIDTLIWRDELFKENHYMKYPVIKFNLKSSSNFTDYDSFLYIFKEKFHTLYKQHRDIYDSDKLNNSEKEQYDCYLNVTKFHQLQTNQVLEGLKFLIQSFYSYFEKKVIVLIDDYDYFITKSIINNCSLTTEIIEFHKLLFNSSFKNKTYLERFIMTGISTIPHRLPSFISCYVKEFSFSTDTQFKTYYGFTIKELRQVLRRKGLKYYWGTRDFLSLSFGGYGSHKFDSGVINMDAVVRFLKKPDKNLNSSYWLDTDITNNLNKFMEDPVIFKKFLILSISGGVEIDMKRVVLPSDIVDFKRLITHGRCDASSTSYRYADMIYFQLLFEKGYLTYFEKRLTLGNTYSVKVPNETIQKLLQEKLCDFVKNVSENKLEYLAIKKELFTKDKTEGIPGFRQKSYRSMVEFSSRLEKLFQND